MYKKILVPLDGSALSESILDHVVAIATSCQVPEVVLLRVINPLDESAWEAIDTKVASDLDKTYHTEATNYLEKIAINLRTKGLNVKVEVLTGNPAEEIMKYSQRSGMDLIVMSTHGGSGFSRWVFGSVTDKVIRHTEVPVLIKPAGNRPT
jgi:nucleotide-binding universal stress UspA family protein